MRSLIWANALKIGLMMILLLVLLASSTAAVFVTAAVTAFTSVAVAAIVMLTILNGSSKVTVIQWQEIQKLQVVHTIIVMHWSHAGTYHGSCLQQKQLALLHIESQTPSQWEATTPVSPAVCLAAQQ